MTFRGLLRATAVYGNRGLAGLRFFHVGNLYRPAYIPLPLLLGQVESPELPFRRPLTGYNAIIRYPDYPQTLTGLRSRL